MDIRLFNSSHSKEAVIRLATRFTPKSDTPKSWECVGGCFRACGRYESGIVSIYHSPKSNIYYLGTYVDGCFHEMFAKVDKTSYEVLHTLIK